MKANYSITSTVIRIFLLLVLLCILLLIAHRGYSQTWTWDGSERSDWHTAANWDTNTIPNSASTILIPSQNISNYPVISNDNASISALTLGDYAATQLTINNGKTLTINGNGFTIMQETKLYLDSGTINYNGTTPIVIDNNANILVQLTNNSILNSPNTTSTTSLNSATLSLINSTFNYNAGLTANGSFNSSNSNINISGGFIVDYNYTTNIYSGSLIVTGNVDIYGILNGGISNIEFNGDLINNQLYVRNGGKFYMDKINGSCNNSTPKPTTTSGGSIDFKIPSTVVNGGLLDIGDAEVTFHYDVETQGSALIKVFNGDLTFDGNGTFGNTSKLEIECKGSISILGNGTFEQSGDIVVGDGSLTIGGNAVFANTGNLTAGYGDIKFTGDVIIENTNGTIDAGSSTIIFEGRIIQNNGTFNPGTSTFVFAGDSTQIIEGNDISFYELVVSDSSIIVSSVDITVENDLTIEGDVNFEGDAELITHFPYIVTYTTTTHNELTIEFSQEVTTQSSQNTNNYQITKGGIAQNILSATRSTTNTSQVVLKMETSFYCGGIYHLSIDDVQNVDGKIVKNIYANLGSFNLPEFNASVRNITGSSDSTSVNPGYNATTCPDLTAPDFNPNNNGPYNPGTSTINFRVDHSNDAECTNWFFNYAINGNVTDTLRVNVDEVNITSSESLIEASTSSYVYFSFKVGNIPGSTNEIKFNISNVTNSDCHCIDSSFVDHSVTHTILAMPPIGSFDN